MRTCLIAACLLILALTGVDAFEVGAVIKKIDVENRVAVVVGGGGQEHRAKVARDAAIKDEKGNDLPNGLGDLKEGTNVTLEVEREGQSPVIRAIRLGKPPRGPDRPRAASVGKPMVGLKPLDEMSADDRYKGEDGGLYGGGRNRPSNELAEIARTQSANILPLDVDGKPDTDGKIGLVSISMSNATQEFSRFKQIADADQEKSPRVSIVDCAQGGQTMARWADREAPCWTEAVRRLENARVSPRQVQVAWVKLANAGPSGDLADHGKKLEQDTRQVLANLVERFPNLRIAYLGSRIYGGYGEGNLNPEPYAYEGAFVVRWLIQSQTKGDKALNWLAGRGDVKSPLLLWGPYFWGDGTTPRKSDSDNAGLVWEREDFAPDGTHPSNSGRDKVASALLRFFKTDEHARGWFIGKDARR